VRPDHPVMVSLDSLACGCFLGLFVLVVLSVIAVRTGGGHIASVWVLYIFLVTAISAIVGAGGRHMTHVDKRGVCPVCGIRL